MPKPIVGEYTIAPGGAPHNNSAVYTADFVSAGGVSLTVALAAQTLHGGESSSASPATIAVRGAVDSLRKSTTADARQLIQDAFNNANRLVRQQSSIIGVKQTCALALALVIDNTLYIGNVGNTCIYLYSPEHGLMTLTQENTAPPIGESPQQHVVVDMGFYGSAMTWEAAQERGALGYTLQAGDGIAVISPSMQRFGDSGQLVPDADIIEALDNQAGRHAAKAIALSAIRQQKALDPSKRSAIPVAVIQSPGTGTRRAGTGRDTSEIDVIAAAGARRRGGRGWLIGVMAVLMAVVIIVVAAAALPSLTNVSSEATPELDISGSSTAIIIAMERTNAAATFAPFETPIPSEAITEAVETTVAPTRETSTGEPSPRATRTTALAPTDTESSGATSTGATDTPVDTPTRTATITPTRTATDEPSAAPSATRTSTSTPTNTPTPTRTRTPTRTATSTVTIAPTSVNLPITGLDPRVVGGWYIHSPESDELVILSQGDLVQTDADIHKRMFLSTLGSTADALVFLQPNTAVQMGSVSETGFTVAMANAGDVFIWTGGYTDGVEMILAGEGTQAGITLTAQGDSDAPACMSARYLQPDLLLFTCFAGNCALNLPDPLSTPITLMSGEQVLLITSQAFSSRAEPLSPIEVDRYRNVFTLDATASEPAAACLRDYASNETAGLASPSPSEARNSPLVIPTEPPTPTPFIFIPPPTNTPMQPTPAG